MKARHREIIECIKVDEKRIESVIDKEIEARFRDVICHIFIDKNGIEWLEFFPDASLDSDFMKRIKLKELDRFS